MGDVLRRWLSLIFLLTGFHLGGLRGACLGLLLTELAVWSVGLWWGRSYLSRSEWWPDRRYLTPFLKFSLFFFASNLLLVLCQRSGEALVRLFSGDYVQVAYYGLACSVYLIAAHGIWQLVLSFVPLLTVLLERKETEALKQWIERLLKWLAIGGVLAVFSVLLLGDDLVPLVLGAGYQPVAAHLFPLTLALLTVALSSMGRLLALLYDRPGVALKAAAIQLTTFWGVGPILVARGGSLAGCVSVLAASALYAGYYTWQMRKELPYSLRAWIWAIVIGGLFVPLIWLRSSWPVNIALYGAFVVGYGSLLLRLRIIRLDEFAALRKVLQPGPVAHEQAA
jgi:O-antigen/teichoic acid export membrane protein